MNAPWLRDRLYRRRRVALVFLAVAHKGVMELHPRVQYETPSGNIGSADARAWQDFEHRARPMEPIAVAKMLNERRARRGR